MNRVLCLSGARDEESPRLLVPLTLSRLLTLRRPLSERLSNQIGVHNTCPTKGARAQLAVLQFHFRNTHSCHMIDHRPHWTYTVKIHGSFDLIQAAEHRSLPLACLYQSARNYTGRRPRSEARPGSRIEARARALSPAMGQSRRRDVICVSSSHLTASPR